MVMVPRLMNDGAYDSARHSLRLSAVILIAALVGQASSPTSPVQGQNDVGPMSGVMSCSAVCTDRCNLVKPGTSGCSDWSSFGLLEVSTEAWSMPKSTPSRYVSRTSSTTSLTPSASREVKGAENGKYTCERPSCSCFVSRRAASFFSCPRILSMARCTRSSKVKLYAPERCTTPHLRNVSAARRDAFGEPASTITPSCAHRAAQSRWLV
mmetsp:Transcript_101705/g.286752  ORF Transcript_101705/g.286752 Transcript_101705/m.286752 type:complete len:210 (-) Transcript_101705:655-1284(-)